MPRHLRVCCWRAGLEHYSGQVPTPADSLVRRCAMAAAAAILLAACGTSDQAHSAAQTPIAAPRAGTGTGSSVKAAGDRSRSSAGNSRQHANAVDGPQPHSSCRSVVHIGDSTSDGLVLPAYQPDPALRIPAQYRRVGVARFINEVSGARSIIETWHGFPNASTVARQVLRNGYHGCWVLALGTNDTADVAVGSTIGLAARIRQMMSLIGSQPVMWVNVVSLLSSGPYSEGRMQMWNRALLRACQQYPDMRVYDWAAVAQRGWFVPDGIHYTPQGYAERSRLIANALALGFPAVQPPAQLLPALDAQAWDAAIHEGCLVH
jgi:hypothetical protein